MWKSKEVKTDNIYTVINDELARLHKLIDSHGHSADNMTVFWRRACLLQDELIKALEKQPSHDDDIKDLQESVSEIILTGSGE